MRCFTCGGYSFNADGQCRFCGTVTPIKPRTEWLGKLDIFELGRLLKEKAEKEAREKGEDRSLDA